MTLTRCAKIYMLTLCTLLGCFVAPAWSAQCNITATPLAFGNYDTLSPSPLDSTLNLTISCKPKQSFNITVQFSTGASGSFSQRSMSGPATLLYNLYTDASMSSIIGDGTGGSATLQRVVDRATPWNLTIYGRIPPLQAVPAGIYSDTLTTTILF